MGVNELIFYQLIVELIWYILYFWFEGLGEVKDDEKMGERGM